MRKYGFNFCMYSILRAENFLFIIPKARLTFRNIFSRQCSRDIVHRQLLHSVDKNDARHEETKSVAQHQFLVFTSCRFLSKKMSKNALISKDVNSNERHRPVHL